MFFSYPFHIIRSYSFLLSGMHSLTYRARVGLFDEAFIFTDFNSTSCLANFSSWSWHFLLNPMLSPTKFVCDREMDALAETSWSLLLKGKSVCSKHIQKVSTRLGKKVFFKVDVSSTSSLSRFNMFTVNMLNLDKLEVDDTSAKFTTEITKKYISTK